MIRIAVVDDEPKILNGIVLMLNEVYEDMAVIQGFSNAQELLKQDNRIDILITDISMPEIDGITMGTVIKQKYPDSKIIIISGYENFDYARRAIQLQVTEYLLKPIDRQHLVSVLDNLIKELENADSQDARPIKKEQLQYRLMNKNNPEAKELLKQYYSEECIDYYICIFECGKGPQEYIDFDFKNWLHKKLDVTAQEYEIVHILDSRMAVIFYRNQCLPENVFYSWIDDFQEFRQPLSIGISSAGHNIGDLNRCYQEAFISLKTELYLKSNEVYVFQRASFLDIDLEKLVLKMLNHFVNLDAEIFMSLFTELFDRIKREQPSIYQLKSILDKIMEDLKYLLEKVDVVSDKYDKLEQKIILVDQYRSIRDMEEDLYHFLDIILEEINQIKKLRVEQSVQLATEYINKNYKNDISLDEVSAKIHLNPSYFSTYFKKHTGYNFVDYLTKKRIEEAKKCLMERDYKIADIANEVGFKEARYFARIFKNQVGVTPSQYREIILEMKK